MDLHDFRRDYISGELTRKDLHLDPMLQFEKWLQQIIETGFKDPTAMIVASVDENKQPNQRYVLLKNFSQYGFVWFRFFYRYGQSKRSRNKAKP